MFMLHATSGSKRTGKNEVERTGKTEIRKAESLAIGQAYKSYFLNYSRLKDIKYLIALISPQREP